MIPFWVTPVPHFSRWEPPMTCRAVIGCVLAIALGTFLVSCSPSHKLISIQVTPATATASSGTTAQFKAIGSYIHPPSTNDITDSVTWASSNTAVATINPSTGIAMALSSGTTSITATMSSSSGPIVGTASLTVTGGSGGGLQSINLYPSNPTIPQLGQTNQFIALGVYSPASGSNDLTKQATWASSNVGIATISSPGFPGLATAVGCGTTTITAEDQGVVGQTLLTVSCTPPPTPVLQSITLYPSDPTIPQLGQTTSSLRWVCIPRRRAVTTSRNGHMGVEQCRDCYDQQPRLPRPRSRSRLRNNHHYG